MEPGRRTPVAALAVRGFGPLLLFVSLGLIMLLFSDYILTGAVTILIFGIPVLQFAYRIGVKRSRAGAIPPGSSVAGRE